MTSLLQGTHSNHLDFSAEIRVSPVPVALLMLGVACVLIWVIGLTVLPASLLVVSLITLFVAGLDQKHKLSHICFTLGLVALVLVLYQAYRVPGILTLLAIPAGMAAAMFNLRVAALFGAGETVLLIALATSQSVQANNGESFVAIIAIWVVIGFLTQAYESIYGFAHWAEAYYLRSQRQLEQAISTTTTL
ncbi:MAG TPA: hypothetical protein VGK81_06350, partial [Anaerolineae bacterium]